MKPVVVIPAFNEAKNILKVIRTVRDKGLSLIVVDDGSSDNTYEIVKKENIRHLLRNERNLGKGASLKKAFAYIIENKLDCDSVIIMDADAQHLTRDIDSFIERLSQGSMFIVGNRFKDLKAMPFIRVITNIVMSFILSVFAKQKVPDTQCGFKALKREVLEKIKLQTERYEVDSELILEAAEQGFKIDSIPIESVYSGQRSSINPVGDTIRFILFIFRRR
jgi:glycosyltransferase involved in cell wall biosynthesis